MELRFLRSKSRCCFDKAVSGSGVACKRVRRAAASIEAVMATAVSFTAASLLAYNGMRACRNLYHAIANLVGWPFL